VAVWRLWQCGRVAVNEWQLVTVAVDQSGSQSKVAVVKKCQ
jgi:hypothetical protein